ncbi:MAG: glycerol kinase GlpK [Flavobacteriaceae bacterium]|nr:glycerol kinase GlpK [Flavobacteriaceae bacterium]
MEQYILALDAGTTSSRSILFDRKGHIAGMAQIELTPCFPQSGWVEHDPIEIYNTQLKTIHQVMDNTGIRASQIAGIGITNQRETTILWNKKTGKPIGNAIVWQDRRTKDICDDMKSHESVFKEKTGLVLDPYFSGTKIHWLLQSDPKVKKQAEAGDLLFGTVDSWLVWHLSGGEDHITDITNASRTLLFNIHTLQWDTELLEILGIPQCILPRVVSCSEKLSQTTPSLFGESIPISGIAGDQQAALFGQLCFEKGDIKNTYGTGCFCIINTGNQALKSSSGMLTTIGYQIDGNVHYAIEGSVFTAGALIQWLRDQLGIIDTSHQIEALANTVSDNGGITFIPALSGLATPYWNPDVRGALMGITRGTQKGHIARAALEAIALRTYDIVSEMQKELQRPIGSLKVDGRVSNNDLLMQIQSDLIQAKVIRPKTTETTALGAAFLSGLSVGFWKSKDELIDIWEVDQTFHPNKSNHSQPLIQQWQSNISRVLSP